MSYTHSNGVITWLRHIGSQEDTEDPSQGGTAAQGSVLGAAQDAVQAAGANAQPASAAAGAAGLGAGTNVTQVSFF